MGRAMDRAVGLAVGRPVGRLRLTAMFAAGVVAFACVLAGRAAADGMMFPTVEMPRQPFSVKYHRVTVTIDNQIAKTHVDQAFVNDTDRVLEGTYVFPIPEGARVRDFTMYDGDKPLKGELLTKEDAVRIYEDIVRRQRDPGVLEYVGRDTIRARVFPIPAHGVKRFTVDYAEVISREGNLCRYLYPLSTERFSARPLDDVTITLRVKSRVPIKNVYCPSHEVSIRQIANHEAEVSYEASQIKPATDFVLYYSLSEDDVGLTLLTYKEPGEQGYWMLLASPSAPAKDEIIAKDVVFVLDRTGSMSGEKIKQAKAALRYCLGSLHPKDRFDVVAFNESPQSVGDRLMAASAQNIRKARGFVEGLAARGGTNIDGALGSALRLLDRAERPRYVVFLTDGLPTVGETNVENILKHAANQNEGRARFFVFGVGYDVNVHFLDRLSEGNQGVSEYVRPQEDIEAKVSRFYAKVASPVLTNVSLEIGGPKTADVFPRAPYPDMFAGSQAIFVGTYQRAGTATFRISGQRPGADGRSRTQAYATQARLPARDTNYDFVPVLWASRKIGYLLDQVRLHRDKELIDEIIRLSKEFGIMTEFTAFLVTEPGMNIAESRERATVALDAAASRTSGSWSVGQTQNASRLRTAAAPQAAGKGVGGYGGFRDAFGAAGPAGLAPVPMPSRVGSNQAFVDAEGRVQAVAAVQNVGRQTFYQRGNAWVDQRANPRMQTVRVQRFSEAHFQLARASAEARRYLALGDNVTFVMNNQAIIVSDEGKSRLTAAELKAIIGSASG